jgi:MFS family permease
MLTALALTLLLAGLVAAAVGSVAFETGIDERLDATTTEISVGSVVAGIVVLAIAFLVGGWAAGRMSRYDGGRNGMMTAVWFLVLGLVLAGLGVWLGDEYNIAQRVDLLPDWFGTWFEQEDVTVGAIVSGVASIAVILLAGFSGGKLGERFHRRADDVIIAHESGTVVTQRRTT